MYNDFVKERNDLSSALQRRGILYGVLSEKGTKGETHSNN